MKIKNPNDVVVLNYSDDGALVDRDGDFHSVFQQDRRLLILSVPRNLDLNAATTAARDLIEVVAVAMNNERETT